MNSGLCQRIWEAIRSLLDNRTKHDAGAIFHEGIGQLARKDCCERLQKLVYKPLPPWLSTRAPVARGHIHGNPVSRDSLVKPDKARDSRLIHCGGYRANGRLVSGLALIARDLKLVLMSTETCSPGILDLEVNQVPKWLQAESAVISVGLAYTSHLAPNSPKSVYRAYNLIGKVRQRAREISEKGDRGCHYFVALLYWTLDIFRYPEVRTTKKLLALHSASEIVGRFDP